MPFYDHPSSSPPPLFSVCRRRSSFVGLSFLGRGINTGMHQGMKDDRNGIKYYICFLTLSSQFNRHDKLLERRHGDSTTIHLPHPNGVNARTVYVPPLFK